MSAISENGILDQKEYEHFKGTSIRLKFMMQLFGALAAATFIGVLGVLGQAMMVSEAAIAYAATNGAVIGLAAVNMPVVLGLLGVGLVCTLLSCKYMFENVTLDQDFNAKKIAAATTKAQGLGIAHSEPEQNKPVGIPGMAAHEQHADKASDAKWTKKVGGQRHHTEKHADAHEKKPHDASIPKPHVDSWASEVKQADQHAETARTVH